MSPRTNGRGRIYIASHRAPVRRGSSNAEVEQKRIEVPGAHKDASLLHNALRLGRQSTSVPSPDTSLPNDYFQRLRSDSSAPT